MPLTNRIMNKIFPMQITRRIYIWMVILVSLFAVILSVLIWQNFLELEKVERGKQLYTFAVALEKHLPGSFEDILKQQGALDKPVEEQVKILNSVLQPIVDETTSTRPNVGVGYYSIELDHVLAISPNFSPSLLKPVPHSYPYFKIYKTGKPELIYHKYSIGWKGEPILNQTYPIYRNSKLIGHTWASMKMDRVYTSVMTSAIRVFGVGLLLLGAIIFLAWLLR